MRVATIELTKDNFETTVNNNRMVIVDFWAPAGVREGVRQPS